MRRSILLAALLQVACDGCGHSPPATTCPSVASLHDQDLRDTAVTWMSRGGATPQQVISVTGHTLKSAHDILKHYLATDAGMGDSAIRAMIAWYDSGDETESG